MLTAQCAGTLQERADVNEHIFIGSQLQSLRPQVADNPLNRRAKF
jgi:hypothetical protein